ncbi:hypothetical protein, variant [Blastomyces dermatitidis ER-3]|uniref:Uncharacterized protein n=3 Tax=Blastomyces TaxID=229219 RepID=A0A179V109_BLAGS|nr:hypothetical protein, variant 2 [Blastomyces gilchristii SLH14081]XP_045281112.1 hypothetical protein, variant [Blastomyces dermatitidis ER-3]KMW67422.1 hypothetical protein, variant [Blastomyces dermatitidis ATCC 18188]OAT01385.1 hypothetical protein, variant [Blastomyces dermatitidis ER-3]OAT13021.1 hypothetical protein, variant 2 [Blastomyces gilchristii SLH14081]
MTSLPKWQPESLVRKNGMTEDTSLSTFRSREETGTRKQSLLLKACVVCATTHLDYGSVCRGSCSVEFDFDMRCVRSKTISVRGKAVCDPLGPLDRALSL